jgi:hypothetical protein
VWEGGAMTSIPHNCQPPATSRSLKGVNPKQGAPSASDMLLAFRVKWKRQVIERSVTIRFTGASAIDIYI